MDGRTRLWVTIAGVALFGCLLVGRALYAGEFDGKTGTGIAVRRGAVVLYGKPANCSRPATVALKRIQRATKEWKTIRTERVREGSARYDLLISQMNRRIHRAAGLTAEAARCDCVIAKADLVDARGLLVRDLTKELTSQVAKIKIKIELRAPPK